MRLEIKIDMKPINDVLKRLGVDPTGDVQSEVTKNISNRLFKYIPHRSGVLRKSKFITSPTTIGVNQPYAAYQYFGKVMVGPPPKVATDRPLRYNTSGKPLAGPLWDKRMMAAEGKQIAAEIQAYVNRKAGK